MANLNILKRYDAYDGEHCGMFFRETGKWVKFEDVVALFSTATNNESDEICQWKDTGHGEYVTQCGYEYNLWHLYEVNKSLEGANMRYCPHCGRKLSPIL